MALSSGILVNFSIRGVHPLFEVSLVEVVGSFGNEVLFETIFDNFLTLNILIMDDLLQLCRHFGVFNYNIIIDFDTG